MTKEDFELWKDNPITKDVLSQISDIRDQYRDSIIGMAASGQTVEAARVAGNIESLDFLLNIQWEGPND